MRKNVVTRNQLYIQNCIVEITRVLKSSEKENVTKTTHLDWGKKGGARMKLLAHTIILSLMEKNINI